MKTVMRARQWAEKYPELGTDPVPVEPCISEEHFELEREGIFRRAWLCVGRVDDLPESGDYFVREIAICKVSVLVIRGPDGKVRGFHNVCSHRGNRLVSDECGTRWGRSIHCPYHHWVYNTRGELIRVPDEENFFGLEKGDHGLAPVHTDTWEGFIFVNLAATPPETLRDWLGEVAEQLDGCPFHEMKRAFTYRVEVDSNWKVILDGQNELYHLPMLHRRLVGKDFVVNAQGNIRYRDVRLYNHHGFYALDFPSFRTVTPLRVALGADIHEAPAFHVPQMIGHMDQYMLFPNFVIDVIKFARSTALVTYSTWPLEVGRTVWEIRFHFKAPVSVRDRLRQESFKRVTLDILQEDVVVTESVYAGLVSRAKSHMILQDSEIVLRHRHKVTEDFVGFYRTSQR
ncbi:MAG: Rieske 2Fe-2S domain-containing protein [Gammaproteobacteria bacterium]|nr:Rieske 2Fe-2S domain-containing protein [Gammaproteobacteria bacterium]